MPRLVFILSLLILCSGCNTGSSSVRDYGSLPEALPRSEGELLFVDARCVQCHGYQGGGNGFLAEGLATPPPDFTLKETLIPRSDADLATAIRQGKGGSMPAYPRLTDQQIQALIRYLRTFSNPTS